MTKTELKMVLKIIDLHTKKEETHRDCWCNRIDNITKMKKDIEELFENSETDSYLIGNNEVGNNEVGNNEGE